MQFATEGGARRFERYLKSGSGRAFSKRHFSPREDDEREIASPATRMNSTQCK
jgi:hypothetical protein